MDDTCVAETPSSSSRYCDDIVSSKPSVTNITTHGMAASSRPCDPRDFKKSRAYQYKTLDQNMCQLERKITQEKSMVFLDRSILTPITDGDLVNDIKMTANANVEEYNMIVSEEPLVDLTIDSSIDICLSETVEVMEVDATKREENTVQSRKIDTVVVVEENDKIKENEGKALDNLVLVNSKIEMEEDKKAEDSIAVFKEDKMEVEDKQLDSVKIVEGILEAEDNSAVELLEEKDKLELSEDRSKNNAVILVEEKKETKLAEDREESNAVILIEEKEGEMETAESVAENIVGVRAENNAPKDIKETKIVGQLNEYMEIEEKMEVEVDNVPKKDDNMKVEMPAQEQTKMVNEEQTKIMDEVEVKNIKKKDDNMEVEMPAQGQTKMVDEVEINNVKKKDDNMDVEMPAQEQVMDHMDFSSITDTSNTMPLNTATVTSSTLTVSKSRVKSELFDFNPEPIDDDLSLPSSKELSNQVLSYNFLRDIENLNDSIDIVDTSMSRVLNKPLIPSCSAFRSSVLSNVTSTVRSGSSQSVSGKQNMKNLNLTKPSRKSSSPRKVVHRTTEKSVSKKSSVSKRNTESLESEKLSTAPVTPKPIKPKPVTEQVRKYTTRRTACLDESKQAEHKSQTKPSSSMQEKTLVKDMKLSPNKHTSLQPSSHKDKVKPKPLQVNVKASKSPSKTPAKSPSRTSAPKTTPIKSPLTWQLSKLKSPTTPRSHAKTMAKAPASNSDPIPVWITWKCCLCSRGNSQDQLGFLYGPYKSQTDDCLSVGSKRTRDDTDNDSSDERQTTQELWVHEGCACWAPGVCLVGNELHGLAEAVKNAKDLECVGCHQPGATISCSNRGCKASFHYPCAIKAGKLKFTSLQNLYEYGCSMLPDQLLLLCHTHNTQDKTV